MMYNLSMNIMFLIFSFNVGGIERLLIDMSRCMLARGQNVFICIINDDYTPSLLEQIPEKVHIIMLHRPTGDINKIKYMNRLSRVIKDNHIQILHCQGVNCVIFSLVAKLMNPATIVINTVHTCGNYTSYSGSKIWLQNRICSMTIAISHTIESEILTRNMSKSRVTTIYNAINTDRFYYIPSDMNTHLMSSSSSISTDTIQIGCVARIYPSQKGQDTLIKAILILLKHGLNVHCNLAGDLFKGQEKAFAELKLLIHNQNADDFFSFFGNVDDVPSFLRKQDMFVLPSHSEGFGIALIEAMSCGLPCVASRLAGPAEIISNSSLGLLFTPGDENDLADKLTEMINNKCNYDNKHISQYVKDNFQINDMVDKHLNLYRSLL